MRRRWWIAAGAAAAGSALTLVLVLRGGAPVGGKDSSDAVVSATLAALAAGDVDALVALADPVALHALAIRCADDEPARDHDGDLDEGEREAASQTAARQPREVMARERVDWAPLAARTRGSPITLVRTRPDAAPGHVANGEPMMQGCTATTDLRFHRVTATIRVRDREQDVVVGVVEARGRYFLSTPPRL